MGEESNESGGRIGLIDHPLAASYDGAKVRAGDLRTGDGDQWQLALLRSLNAHVRISGCLATIEVQSIFLTPTASGPRYGYYAFPLPSGAVFAGFHLDSAEGALGTAIWGRRAARLLDFTEAPVQIPPPPEFRQGNLAVIPVGELPEGIEVVTRLTYSEILPAGGALLELQVPLRRALIGPGDPLHELTRSLLDGGEEGSTGTIVPPSSLGVLVETDGLDLDPGGSGCSLPVEVEEAQMGVWQISMEPATNVPDRDLLLRLRAASDGPTVHLAVTEEPSEGQELHNFALSLIPPAPVLGDQPPRDMIVVVDPSLDVTSPTSLSGPVVRDLLEALGPEDRFNLFVAGDRIARFHVDPLVPATEGNLVGAVAVLKSSPKSSQSRVVDGVRRAVRLLADLRAKGRNQAIALISQAPPGGSTEGLQELTSSMSGIRFMIAKIGPDPVDPLLTRLARYGRGRVVAIRKPDDVVQGIDRLLAGLEPAILTQLEFRDKSLGIEEGSLVPSRLKDLLLQTPVVQLGRCKQTGGALVMRGVKSRGEPMALPITARTTNCEGLFHLWGRARLDRMIKQARKGDHISEGSEQEIAEASRQFGVACPLSSWVVVQEDMVRRADGELAPRSLPLAIAAVPGAADPPPVRTEARWAPSSPGEGAKPEPEVSVEAFIQQAEGVDSMLETVSMGPVVASSARSRSRKAPSPENRALLRLIDAAKEELSGSSWTRFRLKKWSPTNLIGLLQELRHQLGKQRGDLSKLYNYGVPEYGKWGIDVAIKDLDNLLIGLKKSKTPVVEGIQPFLKELERAIRIRWGLQK